MTGFSFGSRPFVTAAAAICTAFVLTTGLAFGESASVPSAASLVDALKAKGPTRGVVNDAKADLIKSLKQKSSRGIAITAEERNQLSDAAKTMPNYDMEIRFELNSAEISPSARPAIDALGHALQNAQLKGASFLLAGHTDATGSASYNQSLSERRAQSVRETLVKEFNLTDDQLIAVGYGPEQPKNPKAPFAPENRRVQIVNLGE